MTGKIDENDSEGSSLGEVLAMVGSGKIKRFGTKERRRGDEGERNSHGFSHLPKSVFVLAFVTEELQRYAIVAYMCTYDNSQIYLNTELFAHLW